MNDAKPRVSALGLLHPDLVFHIDVTLTDHEGRWLVEEMLADEPDIGTGTDPREVLGAALGEPYAADMAARAELPA